MILASMACNNLMKILFTMRTKSYWIKQTYIANTDLFIEYLKTIIPWISSIGGTIIAKDIKQNSNLNEWDGGQLGVIVEFQSREAAKEAFYSSEFQDYIQLRKLKSDLSLTII